ncbi:MAG: PIN domain-containing protein [Deltaproteobacteria bacterium]|nr:PIN domain-containing protein [Deltaproteobacteria bacterium]
MKDRTFVDTNILVYAHDLDAGNKHEIARGIVLELWESRSGMLSTQVLQEFYMTLTRKIPTLLAKPTVRGIVKSYFNWDVVLNDADALIVSAAFSRNAATILTEDLNHGQYVEGILIKNPFKAQAEGNP